MLGRGAQARPRFRTPLRPPPGLSAHLIARLNRSFRDLWSTALGSTLCRTSHRTADEREAAESRRAPRKSPLDLAHSRSAAIGPPDSIFRPRPHPRNPPPPRRRSRAPPRRLLALPYPEWTKLFECIAQYIACQR